MTLIPKYLWSIIASIFFIFSAPILVLGIFKQFYPADPDVVFSKFPSLFPAKWEKISSSNTFSEFLDKTSVVRNKVFLLSGNFAKGDLIGEPQEPVPIATIANQGSVVELTIQATCEAANMVTPNHKPYLDNI